jgi:hypothetical protein
MARIEGVSETRAAWLARLAYRFARRRLGKVPEPVAVTAHHAWILGGMGAYELALERARLVDPKLKALASIKAAALVGCPF